MDFEALKLKYEKKNVIEYPNQVDGRQVVSVCVQTYQHEPYIRQCLDGILMQVTNFNFEILIGEDGSNDGTREICLEYAKKYPGKIKLFLHHRENNIYIDGKPTGRFNFLYNLYSAKGKYLAICEGDDYWIDPNKLQKQVQFLENNGGEYVGVYTNHKICDTSGHIVTMRALKDNQPKFFDRLTIFGKYSSQTLTVVYKNLESVKKQLTEFNGFLNADRVLAVLTAQYGKIKFLDFVSGTYRWGSGIHSTKQEEQKRKGRIELYKAFKIFFGVHDISERINIRLNELYMYEIWKAIIRRDWKSAKYYNSERRKETKKRFMFLLLIKFSYNALLSKVQR